MRNFKQFHSADKCEKGEPLGTFNIHFVAKYQKIEGGTLETLEIIRKKSLTKTKGCGKSLKTPKKDRL